MTLFLVGYKGVDPLSYNETMSVAPDFAAIYLTLSPSTVQLKGL